MKKITNPYIGRPKYTHWKNAVSRVAYKDIDMSVSAKFAIDPESRVSTAGSCFAQHISRHMKMNGFNFYVAEQANPIIPEKFRTEYNYDVFSARYGNIYTVRQLLQLFKRAYGIHIPHDDIWREENGFFVDPYRPNIQPSGFSSEKEFYLDREKHYKAVRSIFEDSDVFIFTLGLTECWYNTVDGSVYPLCPGVAAGQFNPDEHKFINFTYEEVKADMEEFLSLLKGKNPNVRVLMTVSPVALMATMEDRHVIVSTTLSKSILRVVCDHFVKNCDYVDYFPSYEIIMSPFNDINYFEDDKRGINPTGVMHAMRVFLKNYCSIDISGSEEPVSVCTASKEPAPEASESFDVLCDEELLEAFGDELDRK